MSLPIRDSVRVLLLNDNNELLLICADDPKTTTVSGKYSGKFWFTVGGEIEPNESPEEAALREIYEEAGITKEMVILGPVVWFGEFNLILNGTLTHLKQRFMVAKTKQVDVSFAGLTEWEKSVMKKLAWFSFEKIKNSNELIYPVLLPEYLPDILSGKYPDQPLKIDLGKNRD